MREEQRRGRRGEKGGRHGGRGSSSQTKEISQTETWNNKYIVRNCVGTSLVAKWLRIHLPMQGTRVRALVWEDPTYRRATKPMHHNY